MSARVYRLAVTYPAGSHDEHGQPVRGWEPPDLDPYYQREAGFSWPRPHLYLSQSGAEKRAALLRSFGATVTVEASQPITWDGGS